MTIKHALMASTVLGIVLASSVATDAATITFDVNSATNITGFTGYTNPMMEEDGYNVEWFWGLHNGHSHLTSVGGSLVENNHNNYFSSLSLTQAQGFRITKVGGGAFSLASVDLAGQIAIGDESALDSAAEVTASAMSLLTSGTAGGTLGIVTAIPTGFDNVTELYFTDAYVVNAAGGPGGWTGVVSGNYVDNIVLGAAIPEPASLGLMAVFGGAGFFIRR
ncbi:MAG: PEP-CTERM sorting domain-containing protein, partial [Kiritimatiellales bacterium]|nr:PEP-CTERM sorting domain-containing protein [Kiritimatiellales bacterium]